ncbi:MAG: DUF1786 domain-containing protein, partial [Chloroflexi bacterium]|nr:DUF1786 domain-containing protein [Chloroflexota bacterium]
MRILAVDVGTGTQDILVFDSSETIENCPKMVMPSPTLVVANEIRRATAAREAVFLTGVTMGGGPSAWAAHDHARSGLPIYAMPDAARSFDDDLERVAAMGIRVVEPAEGERIPGVHRIELRDFHFGAIASALAAFGVSTRFDGCAIAVFDHGAAPPDVSDRRFRFEYIAQIVARNDLTAFAYRRMAIPGRLSRMLAVASTIPPDVETLVMDTGPAAILGALEDPRVAHADNLLATNVGNFHTLAFHLTSGRILGILEHHTGQLTRERLEGYLRQLADGTIDDEVVFRDMGHGALVAAGRRDDRLPLLAVTGPRRELLSGSRLDPYFAVPHGDMMQAGCFGLLRAFACHYPDAAPEIERALGPAPLARRDLHVPGAVPPSNPSPPAPSPTRGEGVSAPDPLRTGRPGGEV